MMHRWNKWSHSRCPRCNHNNEDTLHVITCPNEEAQFLFRENVDKLDKWMDKYGTHPAVRYIIISTIQHRNTTTFSEAAEFFLDENESNIAEHIIERHRKIKTSLDIKILSKANFQRHGNQYKTNIMVSKKRKIDQD